MKHKYSSFRHIRYIGKRGDDVSVFIKQLLIMTMLLSTIWGTIDFESDTVEKTSICSEKVSMLQNELKDGNKVEELSFVKEIPHKTVMGEMNNNLVWRFDICSEANYSFSSSYDEVDIEALINDSVSYVVFIDFLQDGSTIASKSLYYKDQNSAIHEVKYIGDSEKNQIIFP